MTDENTNNILYIKFLHQTWLTFMKLLSFFLSPQPSPSDPDPFPPITSGASISHGKESPFAVAVNDWMKWEIRVVGSPATVLAMMQVDEITVPLTEVTLKLLRWSRIPMSE